MQVPLLFAGTLLGIEAHRNKFAQWLNAPLTLAALQVRVASEVRVTEATPFELTKHRKVDLRVVKRKT